MAETKAPSSHGTNMRCADVDTAFHLSEYAPSPHLLAHVRDCKTCQQKHTPRLLLSAHRSEPLTAPGESDFLARLHKLGEAQNDAIQRSETLHQSVLDGDRFFWQGDYDKATQIYRDALMIVKDDQGRVALLNKISRAQSHRHHTKQAISLLQDALATLREPLPPRRFRTLVTLWQSLCVAFLLLAQQLRRLRKNKTDSSTRYGDRSRSAQHIYRELSILSQGYDKTLCRWALIQEIRWALRLQQPLELVVAWGRLAVFSTQHHIHAFAHFCIRQIDLHTPENDTITQAAADFYLGRIAYLREEWEDARIHLERCVERCRDARDACLREASLQHLIRVYRNDGNFANAVRVAGQLLSLYHKLGNLSRLSACCRHFSLIYLAYGDLRRARLWALKALDVANQPDIQQDDRILSQIRCYVLLADLEFRSSRKDNARRFLGEAIRLQRLHHQPFAYIRDGIELLRLILGETQRRHTLPFSQRIFRAIATRIAILRGDANRALALQQPPRIRTQEHVVPEEIAYLYQEYTGDERQPGLREAIPASSFARAFLHNEIPILPSPEKRIDSETLAAIFPVGAVSSRWGRGTLANELTGHTTTQFSNTVEAPWGYFFADDIG